MPPPRKPRRPKHRVTITHVEELVSAGETLTIETDEQVTVQVLGAARSGPDMLFNYIVIAEEHSA